MEGSFEEGDVGPEVAIEGKVAKSDAKAFHALHIEEDMLLFFAEGVSNAAAEGRRSVRKSEKGIGHDLTARSSCPAKRCRQTARLSGS